MTKACFLWGVLRHPPLWQGRDLRFEPGVLHGFAVCADSASEVPVLVARPGAFAQGCVVAELGADALQAMAALEGAGLQMHSVSVELAAGGQMQALTLLPQVPVADHALVAWDLALWATRYGAEYSLAAQTAVQPARLGPLLARAGAQIRAAQPAPVTLRHRAQGLDVSLTELRAPYQQFFAVEEADLRFRRFDGSLSPQVTRACFISCDAVTVLPYDPQRDRVLLVEQFRSGPWLRGDPQPWQLEAIAGRIDAGETPEQAARREAAEEAGLSLGALLAVAQHYPSPGTLTEFLYSYIALTDLPDHSAGIFGLEGEAEDIRGHLISFDHLMALATSGEITNGPLLLSAYWLAAKRAELRRA